MGFESPDSSAEVTVATIQRPDSRWVVYVTNNSGGGSVSVINIDSLKSSTRSPRLEARKALPLRRMVCVLMSRTSRRS